MTGSDATVTLSGRRALVTGGGRGIGAAVCRTLARSGAHVVVSARTPPQIESIAEEIRAAGGSAESVTCDVSDPESIRDMAAEVEAVDILVNNAGVSSSAKFLDTDLVEWERLHRINATGPLLVTQAFLPGMLERGWGRIVNVASIASLVGARYITAYAASKHAVLGMARSLAAELVGTGVTVNTVCPGYVDTPMTHANIERIAGVTGREVSDIRKNLESDQPGGRLITPQEVAFAVMTFLPDAAAGFQGTSLVLDGGGLRR